MYRRKFAFTLVELISTIAIIALIVAVSIPFIADYVTQSRQTADRQVLEVLNDAINRYKTQGGNYNALTEGKPFPRLLQALGTPVNWNGVTHQFLRSGYTIPAATTIEATGSGRTYRLTQFNSYDTGGGSEVSLQATGGFVAVGSSAGTQIVAYSTDAGETWQQATLPSTGTWLKPAYGNGTFLTVSSGTDQAAYSQDWGATWTATTLPASGSWDEPRFGGGTFIVADGVAVYRSTDNGVSWQSSSYAAAGQVAPAYGNGFWITARYNNNQSNRSTDGGATWSSGGAPGSPPSSWHDVEFLNGTFYVFASNGLWRYSTNGGVSFSTFNMPADIEYFGPTYGNGDYVVINDDGLADAAYSTDGLTWQSSSLPIAGSWRKAAYGNGRFVSVIRSGSQVTAYSTDGGQTWQTGGNLPASGTYFGVTFGDGVFVTLRSSSATAAVSADGVTWVAKTLPVGTGWANNVVYGR